MSSTAFAQTFGVKKRPPKPDQFGNVVMNNVSQKNKIAPVVFSHWLHRAEYTCRVCHVDLGFAMTAEETGVREADNRNGLYCGACHNGKEAFGPTKKDLLGHVTRNCDRCHSYGKKVKLKKNFYEFTKGFPRARFGNKVDWLAAEEKGFIKLKDQVPGVTLKPKTIKASIRDREIKPRVTGMPDIIFSHTKHAVWNGCELCHPELFGIKNGSTKFSMQDIFDGKFCGVCHGKVSFSTMNCQRCHAKAVY